jgi:hypothetical protein
MLIQLARPELVPQPRVELAPPVAILRLLEIVLQLLPTVVLVVIQRTFPQVVPAVATLFTITVVLLGQEAQILVVHPGFPVVVVDLVDIRTLVMQVVRLQHLLLALELLQ